MSKIVTPVNPANRELPPNLNLLNLVRGIPEEVSVVHNFGV